MAKTRKVVDDEPTGLEHLGSQITEADAAMSPKPETVEAPDPEPTPPQTPPDPVQSPPPTTTTVAPEEPTPPPQEEIHACGLPVAMVGDRQRILWYSSHHLRQAVWADILIKPEEMAKYQAYKQDCDGRPISPRRFVAALRLFQRGAATSPPREININTEI